MTAKILGLDWFDVVAHAMVTIFAGVMVDSVIHGPMGDAAIAGVLAASVVLLGWRRKRALAAGGHDMASGEVPGDRVRELEYRVAELEAQQDRLLELEERLDFAERLLTRERESQARLPGAP